MPAAFLPISSIGSEITARRGQRRRRRTDFLSMLVRCVPGDEFGQRLVGLAAWLAEFEQHRQQDVAGLAVASASLRSVLSAVSASRSSAPICADLRRHCGRRRALGGRRHERAIDLEQLADVRRSPASSCGSLKKTRLPMTFALALARMSVILACTSRDHGQRPMLRMLRVVDRDDRDLVARGARRCAHAPVIGRALEALDQIAAAGERTAASVTTRPRNQSFFQKPAFIAPPDCFYCFFGRCPCFIQRCLRILRHSPSKLPWHPYARPTRPRPTAFRRTARMNRIDLSPLCRSLGSLPSKGLPCPSSY